MKNSEAFNYVDFSKYTDQELIDAALAIDRVKNSENLRMILDQLSQRKLQDPVNKPQPPTEPDTKLREFSSKFLLVVTTALAFALAQSTKNLPQTVVLLTISIFIHELGHVLAMGLLGYKNLSILFIPFFGALARGESDESNSKKRAIVALAGPLIGLASAVLAISMYRHNPEKYSICLSYLKWALVINIFNLVPVRPLDGGEFLNELFFCKWPRLELAFGFISGGIILLYARSIAIFYFLGFLVCIQTVIRYRFSLIALQVRRHIASLGKTTLPEQRIFIVECIRKGWPAFYKNLETKEYKATENATRAIWLQANKRFTSIRDTSILILSGAIALIIMAVPLDLSHDMTRAINNQDVNQVKDLLNAGGANPNYPKRFPPLLDALENNNEEIFELLLNHGANPNIIAVDRKNFAYAPLQRAVTKNKLRMVGLLLGKGARVNDQDLMGETALMRAVELNHNDIAEILLKNGADPNVKNKDGDTALLIAVGHPLSVSDDVVATLLSHGAERDIRGQNGTALDVATIKGNREIMKMLQSK